MGAKSRSGSWDVLTTRFPGSLFRLRVRQSQQAGGWDMSTSSALMGLTKQEGVLWGLPHPCPAQDCMTRNEEQ